MRVTFNDEMGNLYWKLADGSGETEEFLRSENKFPQLRGGSQAQQPTSWSPDGRILAFEALNADTGWDIGYVTVEGDRTPTHFLVTPFDERSPMVSPGGRWVAYISDESGRDEIYVQPFPGGGEKWLISTAGGIEPMWSPDGRELFYRNPNQMMSVVVETEPGFKAGTPRVVFDGQYSLDTAAGHPRYGVSPDGQHFLMLKREEGDQPAHINVVLNWFEELKRLVPAP
jgi:Tol biopolymer transport system component